MPSSPLLSPLVLLIYTLAAARVTGLVTVDTITDPIRHRVLSWLDDRPRTLGNWIGTLITCQWCAGVWVSAMVVVPAWWHAAEPVMLIPAVTLATAQVIGMAGDLGR